MRSSIRRTWRSVTFNRLAAATCVRCFCFTSCNTFNRSRSRWLKAMRSVSMGPSANHESGHFYFAQTGHSHFAATLRYALLTIERRGHRFSRTASLSFSEVPHELRNHASGGEAMSETLNYRCAFFSMLLISGVLVLGSRSAPPQEKPRTPAEGHDIHVLSP